MLKKRLCFYHDQSLNAVYPTFRLHSAFDFDEGACGDMNKGFLGGGRGGLQSFTNILSYSCVA